MKKFLFLTVTLLFTILTNAQTPPAKTWYYNNYGQKTTVKERWDEDTNGEKHGTYIMYYEDGDRKILGHFNHGKSNGLFEITIYSSFLGVSTITKTSANYQNGLLHGQYKTLKNGELYEIGNYSNNNKVGFWKESKYEDIWSEGNYVNDVKEGEWKNTFARNRSEDEIAFLMYSNPSSHVEKTVSETKKGYTTIFKNGDIVALYDDKGINLFEKYKQELILQQEKENAQQIKDKMDRDFYLAMNDYVYYNGTYDGDIAKLTDFLNTYSSTNINPELIEKAKIAIKNKPDNDAFYKYYENDLLHMKNFRGYIEYQKQFPEGIHISEVKKELKEFIVENTKRLSDTIFNSLQKGNISNALQLCEIILKYKDDIHPTHASILVIYYSLALWSNDNKDKAIEVVKPYANTIIHYSDADKKFIDAYSDYYKVLKNSLNIENDTETYKTIKNLK